MTAILDSSSVLSSPKQPRLRVFAGPNGSGKSTIIEVVKSFTHNGKLIDLGYYINADEIAAALRGGNFSFAAYDLSFSNEAFTAFAQSSGLLGTAFSTSDLAGAYSVNSAGQVLLESAVADERLAQLFARCTPYCKHHELDH